MEAFEFCIGIGDRFYFLLVATCSQHLVRILDERISRLTIGIGVCASLSLLENYSLMKSILIFPVVDELHTVALGFTRANSYVFYPEDYVEE